MLLPSGFVLLPPEESALQPAGEKPLEFLHVRSATRPRQPTPEEPWLHPAVGPFGARSWHQMTSRLCQIPPTSSSPVFLKELPSWPGAAEGGSALPLPVLLDSRFTAQPAPTSRPPRCEAASHWETPTLPPSVPARAIIKTSTRPLKGTKHRPHLRPVPAGLAPTPSHTCSARSQPAERARRAVNRPGSSSQTVRVRRHPARARGPCMALRGRGWACALLKLQASHQNQ